MVDTEYELNASRKRRFDELSDILAEFSSDDNISPDEEPLNFPTSSDNTSDCSMQKGKNCESIQPFVPVDLCTPFRTPYGKIPRLLKNDLRRFYPNMFINMLNYQDRNFSRDYFTKFFLSGATLLLLEDLTSCWADISPEQNNHSKELVFGRGNIMAYYNSLFKSYPDFCATLQDVEIVRSNYSRCSTIRFGLLLRWTEVTTSISTPNESINEDSNKIAVNEISSNLYDKKTSNSTAQLFQLQYQHDVVASASMLLSEQWYVTDLTGVTIASSIKRLSDTD